MNERVMFAITASMFCAVFLVSVIVYGGDVARNAAIGAALLGAASQFTGPDPASYRVSIYAAYAGFVAAAFSLFALIFGA